MKRTILFIIFSFTIITCFSQELTKERIEAISEFIECIKTDDITKLKTLIRYPLKRNHPLPDIKNREDFVERYDEIFDDSLKHRIINSDINEDWSLVGWRGIMFANGLLWLDDSGLVKAVNYESLAEEVQREYLIKTDMFKEPVLIMETNKFRVRIDELDNGNYRYASWSINSSMSEKPDLILKNGEYIREGTGGNNSYKFKNGIYTYQCSIIVLGSRDSPPARLIVYKNEQTIINQSAQIIKDVKQKKAEKTDKQNTFKELFNVKLVGLEKAENDEFYIDFSTECYCEYYSILIKEEEEKFYLFNYCSNVLPPSTEDRYFEYSFNSIEVKNNQLHIHGVRNNNEELVLIFSDNPRKEVYNLSIQGKLPASCWLKKYITNAAEKFRKEDCGDFDG